MLNPHQTQDCPLKVQCQATYYESFLEPFYACVPLERLHNCQSKGCQNCSGTNNFSTQAGIQLSPGMYHLDILLWYLIPELQTRILESMKDVSKKDSVLPYQLFKMLLRQQMYDIVAYNPADITVLKICFAEPARHAKENTEFHKKQLATSM